jgi:hypothetical protein
MKVLKLVDVSQIQAGDIIVLNRVRYVVDFTDKSGIAYDLELHDWKGSKVRKCLVVGEKVALEM